jgi:hypothetical protein
LWNSAIAASTDWLTKCLFEAATLTTGKSGAAAKDTLLAANPAANNPVFCKKILLFMLLFG